MVEGAGLPAKVLLPAVVRAPDVNARPPEAETLPLKLATEFTVRVLLLLDPRTALPLAVSVPKTSRYHASRSRLVPTIQQGLWMFKMFACAGARG